MFNFDEVKRQMLQNERMLRPLACVSGEAIRKVDEGSDIRGEFAKDADKILHTLSYTRYIDKTQVFSDALNDNVSTRMTHVQFVSRASRTIARALGLNEDLCEAIALGHDIGHSPFGHEGERILNEISKRKTGNVFAHNLNSVRTLTVLERNGKGCNLTLQVLDGIMCHNGEMIKSKYTPVGKNFDLFEKEYIECLKDENKIKSIRPMTMEGCVVRISDIIGYIGKDIEDAVRLGKLNKMLIPESVKRTLGTTNAQIMNTIILDIIDESFERPYIQMSDEIYEQVMKLREFNYQNIYFKANNDEKIKYYNEVFKSLYEVYERAIHVKDIENSIYTAFLDEMSDEYLSLTSTPEKVIDYMSGMTDNYIEREYERYVHKNI